MAQLMVRNVDDAVVRELKKRAARRKHSAEQEHREILEQALWRPRRLVTMRLAQQVAVIVSQHGWPSASLVGAEAASAASLILQHADTARQERYLPLVREAVTNGRGEALSLAELEDEISVANTGLQLYGTEISFDPHVGHSHPVSSMPFLFADAGCSHSPGITRRSNVPRFGVRPLDLLDVRSA